MSAFQVGDKVKITDQNKITGFSLLENAQLFQDIRGRAGVITEVLHTTDMQYQYKVEFPDGIAAWMTEYQMEKLENL